MKRFNIFNQIHKGLRVLLYDTATVLQQTDFSDAGQTRVALEKVNKVLHMFSQHGKNEEQEEENEENEEENSEIMKMIELETEGEEEDNVGGAPARELANILVSKLMEEFVVEASNFF